MKAKAQTDIVTRFQRFHIEILEQKPAHEIMRKEIGMMRFKIRPLYGEVTELNFDDPTFIETLWTLGKLDEFYHDNSENIPKADEKVFYQIFDGVYGQYQDKLNDIRLKTRIAGGDDPSTNGFEVEIYRERRKRHN